MSTRAVTAVLLLLSVLYPAGLSAQDYGVTVRDSAGVRIVESRTPLWSPGREWSLSTTPILSIGGPGAPPDQFVVDVFSMLRRRDGTLILKSNGNQVRWYSSTGQLMRTRDAFQNVASIHLLAGDSVGVVDSGQQRFTVLTAEGDVSRTISLSGIAYRLPTVGVLADGSIVGFMSPEAPQSGSSGIYRPDFTFVHWDARGVGAYLFQFPGQERFVLFDANPGALLAAQPFFRTSLWGTYGNELLVAPTETAGFRAHAINGAVRMIVRGTADPRPITDQEIQAWRESIGRLIARAGSPGTAGRLQARLDMATFPPSHPVLAYRGPMIADPEGNVWQPLDLTGDAGAPMHFSVYRADGRWLGTVQMPQRFRPLDIGADYVAGVLTDEAGVESAQVYALRKP